MGARTEFTENWNSSSGSEIRQFYAGKNVLLTGCTGFLGTIILEKILRSCNDISKVYVLLRPKKGLSAKERLGKRLTDSVYCKLREMYPNFDEKIVPLHGDLSKPCLDLCPEDRRRLVENVNIIIHNASMVSFEARPSVILRINVIGTLKLLELATECSKLEMFAYVSTAYSHPHVKDVEEKFYPPPMDIKGIENIIRADEESEGGISEKALHDFVGNYLNIYAFSKGITESLVEQFGKTASFHCIIYRPSIVLMPYAEPITVWWGSQNGPMFVTLTSSLGITRVIYGDRNIIFDVIPVDMTTNYLLALISDHVTRGKLRTPEVYNYGSSDWNPLRLRHGYEKMMNSTAKYPSLKLVWYPFVIWTANFYLFLLLHTLLHVIPGAILDFSLAVKGKRPMICKSLFRATKLITLLRPFILNSWLLRVDKAKNLRGRMNATDLKEFNFDLGNADWQTVASNFAHCIRAAMGDAPENLPQARRKYRVLKTIHYIICPLVVLVLLYYMCQKFL